MSCHQTESVVHLYGKVQWTLPSTNPVPLIERLIALIVPRKTVLSPCVLLDATVCVFPVDLHLLFNLISLRVDLQQIA